MRVVFDEPKRLANLLKHGLDFRALEVGFFEMAVIVAAKRERFIAFGLCDNRWIAVVFKPLGERGRFGNFDASGQEKGAHALCPIDN